MAGTIAREDIDAEEFRKLLTAYKVQLTALHGKQRAGILGETVRSPPA